MPTWTEQQYEDWNRRQNVGRVGSVQGEIAKPIPSQTLERGKQILSGVKESVAIRVVLVIASKRRLDDDNLQGACKFLRDGIAETLGTDDGDPRLTWEYHQIQSRDEGVIVKITVT